MWVGLNRLVHEGKNHVSNVKVHLKTRSGNVNMFKSNDRFIIYLALAQHTFVND